MAWWTGHKGEAMGAVEKDLFSKRLRAIMVDKGLSMRALAERSGCGYASIHGWYHGLHLPRHENFVSLAKALDMTPLELAKHIWEI